MIKPVLFSAMLALSSCDFANMQRVTAADQYQIVNFSDAEICKAAHEFPDRITMPMRWQMEVRELGDCSKDHLKCAGYGLSKGSPAYAQCRMGIEAQRQAAAQAAEQQRLESQKQENERWEREQQMYLRALGAGDRTRTQCKPTPDGGVYCEQW